MISRIPIYKRLALLYMFIGVISFYFGYHTFFEEKAFFLDIRTINSLGLIIAVFLWFGKEFGRKLAIGLGGYNLLSLIIQLYLVFYDYLQEIPSITQEHNISLIEELRTIVDNIEFILIVSAFLALFQMWILWILIEKKDAFNKKKF